MNIVTSGNDYLYTSNRSFMHAYLSPVIVTLCQTYAANSILDIGCGNGALAKTLTESKFEHVVGCEPSESGVQFANAAVPTAKFYQLSIYDDPEQIAETEFDVAISTEVIEHVYYPRELPRFAHAKLKTGSYLILSTPYHGYLKNLDLSIFNKWDSHHTVLWDGGHIKFWSRQTLTKLLEEEGFHFEKFIGCGRLPFLWMSMIIVARKV